MRIGLALNCTVAPSVFHRKNYFYPDMPKDYQISQYDAPINIDGFLELPDRSRVGIERAHIEEDTGKSTHVGGGGRIHGSDYSLIDYNRAGVPLVEIVSRLTTPPRSRPVPTWQSYARSSSRPAPPTDGWKRARFAPTPTSRCGSSARPSSGRACEVKNLNSLRSLGRAIDYEARRQVELVDGGERVVQETRHWNEQSGRHLLASVQGRGLRLPATSPSPTSSHSFPTRPSSRSPRSAVGALPAERRARLNALDPSGQLPLDQVVTVVDPRSRRSRRRRGGPGGRTCGWHWPARRTKPPPDPKKPAPSTRGDSRALVGPGGFRVR